MISKQTPQSPLLCDTNSQHTNSNIMESIQPENLSKQSVLCETNVDTTNKVVENSNQKSVSPKIFENSNESMSATKIKLSFSVDRLLNEDIDMKCQQETRKSKSIGITDKHTETMCCDPTGLYSCCTIPNCFASSSGIGAGHLAQTHLVAHSYPGPSLHGAVNNFGKYFSTLNANFLTDYKSILRPTPIRAMGGSTESAATLCTPSSSAYSALASNALLRFHQHQHQQHHQQQQRATTHINLSLSTPMMTPLNGLKSLQLTSSNRFLTKSHNLLDLPTTTATATSATAATNAHTTGTAAGSVSGGNTGGNTSNNAAGHQQTIGGGGHGANNGKRKRSWSRAVFTNLQRKGLEIQFQQQKYITKPDRRKLAARLNLTDAQVKVWFQNRRMKWRHTRENLKSGQEKQPGTACSIGSANDNTDITKRLDTGNGMPSSEITGYSSDCTTSVDLSENEDDDGDEIDVVE